MKYAIYFTWKDGFNDSFNIDGALERNEVIMDMLTRDVFKYIAYAPIYVNGEYGKRKTILKDNVVAFEGVES